MDDAVIRQLKKRRDELHRRIRELRAELKDVEARADELERIWKEAIQGHESDDREWKVPHPSQIDKRVPRNAAGLIMYALEEFERHGFEGVDRATIVDVVRIWSPKMKPNTIRVTFKRLMEKGRIEKIGNLYRPAQEEETARPKASPPNRA